MFLKYVSIVFAAALCASVARADPLGGIELPERLANAPSTSQVPADHDLMFEINEAHRVLSHRVAGSVSKRVPTLIKTKHGVKSGYKIERNYNTLLSVSVPGFIQTVRYSDPDDFVIERGKPNGINTPFTVTKPEGYAVVAVRHAIHAGEKQCHEVVYTPYSPAIDTVAMRKLGYAYLYRTLEKAYTDLLNNQHIRWQALPGKKVATLVPLNTAIVLSIIEHIDPDRLQDEPIENLVNEVLVPIGANQKTAYKYAGSSKGARGLMQFVPKTYERVRRQQPGAHLIRNFVAGMDDQENAAKAAFLLFDSDLAQLPLEKRKELLDPATPEAYLAQYLAAAYNGGAPRVVASLRQGGAWESRLAPETRDYIKKLDEVRALFES